VDMSDWVLSKPSLKVLFPLKFFTLLSIIFIGYLHFIIGPSFEFHLFFLVPIMVASWFTGVFFCYFVLCLTIFSWTLGDYLLASNNIESLPFLFNSTIHALILAYITYLLRYIRHLLIRESQLAREDSLTKIPNRRSFYESGEIAFSTGHRQQLPVTIIFIDVDSFKSINDTYGHKIGDKLLFEAAQVMNQHVRKNDVLGRIGGDEFCLILLNVEKEQAHSYATNLKEKLAEKMYQHQWQTTFSMGIVTYRVTPPDFLNTIEQADKLMYEVKSNGRNGFSQAYFP
jgi:diguanylate cyclase (GGDEF)-like protein